MNLPLLALSIAIISYITVPAQSSKSEIGIEGGPSLISLRGNDVISGIGQPSIGYVGGLSFQHNFSDLISLRSGLTFERKGNKVESDATDNNGNKIGVLTSRSNLDYLNLPLLLRFNFGNKIKFFANLGPYFSYLIKHELVHDSFGEFKGYTVDNIEKDQRFDYGFSGGLGSSIPIKDNFILSLEVRHNYGLYNISKAPVINNGEINTNSTNLLVGFAYRINCKKED